MLPSLDAIDDVRRLSHRASAASLLAELTKIEGTVGEAVSVFEEKDLRDIISTRRKVVVKAPWSSSGRGVRFIDGEPSQHVCGWLRNVLSRQGSLMVEPYYKKVKDFGMEFYSDGRGRISYLGLSLFHTVNGAYSGNILATEKTKNEMIKRYVSDGFLCAVKDTVCRVLGETYRSRYEGPFGIDMMIVARDSREGFLLHPCVEINLRRTMGHVALCLSPTDDDIKKVMRISAGSNYMLGIQQM